MKVKILEVYEEEEEMTQEELEDKQEYLELLYEDELRLKI